MKIASPLLANQSKPWSTWYSPGWLGTKAKWKSGPVWTHDNFLGRVLVAICGKEIRSSRTQVDASFEKLSQLSIPMCLNIRGRKCWFRFGCLYKRTKRGGSAKDTPTYNPPAMQESGGFLLVWRKTYASSLPVVTIGNTETSPLASKSPTQNLGTPKTIGTFWASL